MKIQINSLAALERLIGGDTELEIEVRNSIVQAFAQKHLKPLANESALVGMVQSVRNTAAATAQEFIEKELGKFTGPNGWSRIFVLRDEIKKEIQEAAKQQIYVLIDEAVKQVTSSWTPELIEKQITRIVNQEVELRIRDGVKQKLTEISAKLAG